MPSIEDQPAPPIELGLDRRERGDSFETLSHIYSAGRPSYPGEFIASLTSPLIQAPDAHVLEVGAGTGQATARLAELFARVTAIEPGTTLCRQTRERMTSHSHVDVHESYFEDWTHGGPYDCIFSASAFHWTDPTRSYGLARNLLKPGGTLAFVTYCELIGDNAWEQRCTEIRALFTRHAPHHKGPRFGTRTAQELSSGLHAYGESIGQALEFVEFGKPLEAAQVPVQDMFGPVTIKIELEQRRYNAEGFVAALESYGAFRRMNEGARVAVKKDVRAYVLSDCQDSIDRPFALVGLAAARTP
ncbi:class I SAM-dependent methyltransferase [Streptomyces sp. NPDC049555]|uniref:class I SAM-dependent methyltransferase n=1 Tax=unclassified Streptomyces TaxID=2593676 RepID=UPI003415ED63